MWGRLTSFLLAVAIALAVLLADRAGPRFDLTEGKRHTLSAQSLEVLAGLAVDVKATAFYRPEDPTTIPARDLLEKYAAASTRFHYVIVDPDRYPGLARSHEIETYGATVVEAAGRRAVIYNYSEGDLTAALLRLVEDRERVVRFVAGHGEKEAERETARGYGLAVERIRSEGIRVETLLLMTAEEIPEPTDLLILAGPVKDFLPREIDRLERYIRGGGRVLLMLDPEAPQSIEEMPRRFGLEASRDVVVDRSSSLYGAGMQVPVVIEYDLHESTRGLKGTTIFPRARSVRLFSRGRGGGEIRSLLRTGAGSWGETDMTLLRGGRAVFREGEDHKGPLLLGMISSVRVPGPAGEEPRRGRLALFGDSDFASNRYFSHGANGDLFLNLVRWLTAEDSPLGIRSPRGEEELLLLSVRQGKLLFWLPVVFLPFSVALLGAVVLVRWRLTG